jgi:hypothetical protein
MNYLIELVFENVFFNHMSQMIKELSQEGKQITNYSLQADWEIKGEINWHSADSITQILNQSTNNGWALFINLTELNLKQSRIKNCTLQILQYDSQYDININFNLDDIRFRDSTDFIENLMKFARKIAFKYGIQHYFAGLEPADDEETRLFTNGKKGPLTLPFLTWEEKDFVVSQVG